MKYTDTRKGFLEDKAQGKRAWVLWKGKSYNVSIFCMMM